MAEKPRTRIFGAGDGEGLGFLQRLPWEKMVIWTTFLLAIFVLRTFFAAIFLTFIFSYIAHGVVRWICHKLGHDEPASKTWRITLIGVFLWFGAVVAGVSWYVAPRVWDQAQDLRVKMLGPAPGDRDAGSEAGKNGGAEPAGKPADGTEADGEKPGAAADPDEARAAEDGKGTGDEDKRVVTAEQVDGVARRLLPTSWPTDYADAYDYGVEWVTEAVNENIPEAKKAIISGVGGMIGLVLSFLVAMIFSFLILWDLPKLGAKVRVLGQSNLKRFYDEIAPGVIAFGGGMGQAFQAQTLIALLNTLLTLIGLMILGIPMKDVLSLIVFLCSFIPVLGVFISTIPIALIALVQVNATTMLLAIVLVLIIHFIEAYILNPRIYGHVMHMHPLIVLVILFIAEALFGLWGVILGVPTCQFVFNYWIKRATGEAGFGKGTDQGPRAGSRTVPGGAPSPAPVSDRR